MGWAFFRWVGERMAVEQVHVDRFILVPWVRRGSFPTVLRGLLAGVLVSDLYLSYVDVGPVSPGNYLVAFAVYVILLGVAFNGAELPPIPNAVVVLGGAILIAASIASFTSPFDGVSLLRQGVLDIGVGAIVATLVYGLRLDDLRPIWVIAAVGVLASGGIAILQWAGLGPAWALRMALGFGGDPVVEEQIARRLAAPGLSYLSVQLGYHLVFGGAALLLCCRRRILCGGGLAFLLLASIAAGSRSSVVGLVVLAFMGWRAKGPIRIWALVLLTVLAMGGLALWGLFTDASALSRLPLALVGLLVLRDHPLGIGAVPYRDVANAYIASRWDSPVLTFLVDNTAHNQLIMSGVRYGWLPLLALLVYLGWLCFRLWMRSTELYAARVFLAAVAAYTVNSFFHNAGPLMGEPFAWFLFGAAEVALGAPPAAPDAV